MTPHLERVFAAEMARACDAEARGELSLAWRSLERAHIVSQPFVWAHVKVHLAMFRFALKRGAWREVAGQVPRIVLAAPASLLGRAPRGNTGGADVGMLTPLPLPPDLDTLMRDPSASE